MIPASQEFYSPYHEDYQPQRIHSVRYASTSCFSLLAMHYTHFEYAILSLFQKVRIAYLSTCRHKQATQHGSRKQSNGTWIKHQNTGLGIMWPGNRRNRCRSSFQRSRPTQHSNRNHRIQIHQSKTRQGLSVQQVAS